jgi:hypothetical protein
MRLKLLGYHLGSRERKAVYLYENLGLHWDKKCKNTRAQETWPMGLVDDDYYYWEGLGFT